MRGMPDNPPEIPGTLAVEIPDVPDGWLIINAQLGMRIKHHGCNYLAYVMPASGVFYCNGCAFGGHIEDIWPAPRETTQRDIDRWEQGTL